MKRFLLLCTLYLSATLTFASEVKKVAILEVVDREGKLSYSQKLLLRSNMARAVTNTVGYEAYDRSDVDVIMSEHEFQHTGLVSDAEIRKLGEMTGVSLILVTEGVLTGDGKIFVSAKILNVETARVEMMDNISMGLSSDDIQAGCVQLSKRLFGATASSAVIEKYKVSRLNSKEYEYMQKHMDKATYERFLYANCSQAYQQFYRGKKYIKGGWASFGVGTAFVVGGSLCMIFRNFSYYIDENGNQIHDSPFLRSMGGAFIGIGVVGVAGSVPLLTIGYLKQKQSVDIYNNSCASSSAAPITFNLTAGQNGLGVAMNF